MEAERRNRRTMADRRLRERITAPEYVTRLRGTRGPPWRTAAMRRTHIWQRRYQSRSDDWLCIGACAGTPRERVEMAVEEVGGLVANPLVPGMKRLLRGGIIHQGGSFLSLPACHSLSFPLSLFVFLHLCLSTAIPMRYYLGRGFTFSIVFACILPLPPPFWFRRI